MKKLTMLKSIAAAALFAVVGMSASAQFIGTTLPAAKVIPTDTSYLADTVSIGAKMPYYLHPDGVISHSSLYNPSGFQWNFNGGGSTGLTNVSGAALTVSAVGTGYYNDTLVMATMPGTTGPINVKVLERSNPKFSATAGCDGNQRTLNIEVIGLPQVPGLAPADTVQGGCGTLATSYNVNYNFGTSTTKFPAYVQVTIKTYDISGAAIGTPTTKWYQINKAADVITIANTDITAVAPSFVSGRVEVSLGQLYDRISLIDSNYNIGAANFTNSLAVDASGVHKAAIMILPAPNTGVIKHIKTL